MELSALYTPEAVDEFIDNQICRETPLGFRQQVVARWPDHITEEERAQNLKIDALCRAFERRAELVAEIASGRRSPSGDLNVSV